MVIYTLPPLLLSTIYHLTSTIMSRIGKQPVKLPSGVTATISTTDITIT